MRTLVKNGLVITFIHEGYHSIKMKYADVLIEDGLFADIKEEIHDPDAKIIDAEGKWVLPGFVDVASACAVLSRKKQLQTATPMRSTAVCIKTRGLQAAVSSPARGFTLWRLPRRTCTPPRARRTA